MSGSDPISEKLIFHLLGEFQEAQRIRDGGPIFSDLCAQFTLADVKFFSQSLKGFSLLNRVKILSLKVFDEGDFQGIPIFDLPH